MSHPHIPDPRTSALWAIAAAIVSGIISAVSLNPLMSVLENWRLDDLAGLLSSFAFTGGLAFGLCGGAVMLWVMKVPRRAVAVFLGTSMVGIAAAVYTAILTYDNSIDNFMASYAFGSPVGAWIVAFPLTKLGSFAHPSRSIAVATVVPTLWAVGVAAVFTGESAMELPGLAALYVGWQVIFLTTFALDVQRDYRPHMPLG